MHGDTLQNIALRELLDASRWPEIAWLNELRPPYLTGDYLDPGIASGSVICFGALIRIPSSHQTRPAVTPAQAFGLDVSLDRGVISADEHGGISIKSGVPNLTQSLNHRLQNELGCLGFHPKYGNLAHRMKGRKSDLSSALLARRFCEESVLSDPRVISISSSAVKNVGAAILVDLVVTIDNGSALRLQVEI